MYKRKGFIISMTVILLVLVGLFTAYQLKHYTVRKEVKHYLLTKKDVSERDITYMGSFLANRSGDKNWQVCVQVKGDEGSYYYFYNTDNKQVELDAYTLDGYEYSSPEEIDKNNH